jgi:hypothetical protein
VSGAKCAAKALCATGPPFDARLSRAARKATIPLPRAGRS